MRVREVVALENGAGDLDAGISFIKRHRWCRVWAILSVVASIPLMLIALFVAFEMWEDAASRGIRNVPIAIMGNVPLLVLGAFGIVEYLVCRRSRFKMLVFISVIRLLVFLFWLLVCINSWKVVIDDQYGELWFIVMIVGSLTFFPGYVYDTWQRFNGLAKAGL